jgi:hypothetical protein
MNNTKRYKGKVRLRKKGQKVKRETGTTKEIGRQKERAKRRERKNVKKDS